MAYQYRGTNTIDLLPAKPELVFKPEKCGTYAGYRQHQNHGVYPCAACKQANSEHVKAFYARKKAGSASQQERRASRAVADTARKAEQAQARKTR